jgi:hypothetical protein
MSAFFRKEILLEKILGGSSSGFIVIMFYFRIFFTVVYATRFLSLFYSASKNSSSLIWVRELDIFFVISLIVLGAPALVGGLSLVNYLFNYSRALSLFSPYYAILIVCVIFLMVVSYFWGTISFRKLNFSFKNQISIWGLSLLSYSLGVKLTLELPAIVKGLDSGNHSYYIRIIPERVKILIA